ncbi:MAG TPA: DUF4438 domain-containing protein [Nocardioidaceae bacterium]|nr:DUF4438 domain-containing protein [Nocardioidaceae bacterium]
MTVIRPAVVATNLSGVVETPELDSSPFRIDADGHPYVPTGDGGIVLGVRLGDSVFATDGDHVAPGACLVHPDQAARHALTSYSCLGNTVTVRSGDAAGSRGVVLGKRGELGRVIACFSREVLARMAPSDEIVVRGHGQGARLEAPIHERGVIMRNLDPAAVALLPVTTDDDTLTASVRAEIPSRVVGNGVGRPVEQWDLDLQVDRDTAPTLGLSDLALGDLVAVTDLDVRHNAGYRRGWRTIGVVVHGASPQPGHGPGLMPLFCGPADALVARVDRSHRGINEDRLLKGTA